VDSLEIVKAATPVEKVETVLGAQAKKPRNAVEVDMAAMVGRFGIDRAVALALEAVGPGLASRHQK